MEEPSAPFSAVLRELRTARGFSLRGLEAVSHHSKSLIADWENGRKVPALDVAERLDHLLDGGGRLAAASTSSARSVPIERIASEVTRHYAHQGPVADEIRRRAAAGRQLDVLAVRGLGVVGLNDSLLRPALTARTEALQVRILPLDPDCEPAAQRAAEIGESPAAFTAGIKLTLARLEEIAVADAGIDLRVSLYATLPIWRIIRVDDMLWMSSFNPGWEGHESTMYEIPESPRGSLWSGYRRQFDYLNAGARRVI